MCRARESKLWLIPPFGINNVSLFNQAFVKITGDSNFFTWFPALGGHLLKSRIHQYLKSLNA